MSRRPRAQARPGRRALAACAASLALLLAGGCKRARPVDPGVMTVSVEQQGSFVRNFNPLLPGGNQRFPSTAGIYEPLFVFNTMKDHFEPWLGTEWRWENDNRTLRVKLRPGVLFSDGHPFDAQDVVFTFDILRRFPALDIHGAWHFLSGVRDLGDEVAFDFARPFVPGFEHIVQQPIVPKHVWEKVDDPVTFSNPNPVATGPFTEVRRFDQQVYEVGRNPHYWQPGKPAVEALRMPAYPSNDAANMALAFGEIDWSGNFVPAVERTYVARDPKHQRYWFPLVGSAAMLYLNTTRAPYDDVRVRKALSRALDRPRAVEIAVFGYTRPSDSTGLTDALAAWRDEKAASADWVQLDPARAARELDEAGLRRDGGGMRRLADGRPWGLEIIVVAGWSDWTRAAQVLSRSLREVGVEATVKTYDFAAWFERVQRGEFDAAIGWTQDGTTPYAFYRWLMASDTVRPVGEMSLGNWHRFGSKEADAVLQRFEVTSDRDEQRRLAAELQRIFAEQAPALPLFPNPSWGAFNTRRFVGFPSGDDPYARLSPNNPPECLILLTRVRPRTSEAER